MNLEVPVSIYRNKDEQYETLNTNSLTTIIGSFRKSACLCLGLLIEVPALRMSTTFSVLYPAIKEPRFPNTALTAEFCAVFKQQYCSCVCALFYLLT